MLNVNVVYVKKQLQVLKLLFLDNEMKRHIDGPFYFKFSTRKKVRLRIFSELFTFGLKRVHN